MVALTIAYVGYGLVQWFLTFYTYLTILSNKIIRFTPNSFNGAHLLKNDIKNVQLRMIANTLHLLQFMIQ